jgi:hypothetical protein
MSAAQATLPSPTASPSPRAPVDTLRQPTNSRPSAYISIAAILAVFILAFATAPKTRAQDNGHHRHHADHYSKWKQPGTDTSCCDGRETKGGQITGDCYPTTAEVRAGSWWAKTDDGRWVNVPDDRIIRERNPDVERAQLASTTAAYCVSSRRIQARDQPNPWRS